MINVSDIMISNKIESATGNIFKISFFENLIVDDFELKHTVLEAVVCQRSENEFVILEDNGYSKDDINQYISKANITKYNVHYYDLDSKDLIKEEICGLKNILKINKSNNIIDIVEI